MRRRRLQQLCRSEQVESQERGAVIVAAASQVSCELLRDETISGGAIKSATRCDEEGRDQYDKYTKSLTNEKFNSYVDAMTLYR